MEAEATVMEPVSLQGPYKINGKVLILPIVGQGLSNLTVGKYLLAFHSHSLSHNQSPKASRIMAILWKIEDSP